jgi:hypothetical protein
MLTPACARPRLEGRTERVSALPCWHLERERTPGGHPKLLHPWPGQTPPPVGGGGRILIYCTVSGVNRIYLAGNSDFCCSLPSLEGRQALGSAGRCTRVGLGACGRTGGLPGRRSGRPPVPPHVRLPLSRARPRGPRPRGGRPGPLRRGRGAVGVLLRVDPRTPVLDIMCWGSAARCPAPRQLVEEHLPLLPAVLHGAGVVDDQGVGAAPLLEPLVSRDISFRAPRDRRKSLRSLLLGLRLRAP